MKPNFREIYISVLAKTMEQNLVVLPDSNRVKEAVKAEDVIVAVETQTNSRLTKRAPGWFYAKVQAELSRRIGWGKQGRELALSMVADSKAYVLGNPAERNAEAVILGAEFLPVINALKATISKGAPRDSQRMVQIFFTETDGGHGQFEAYAWTNWQVIRVQGACLLSNGEFSGFIEIPRIKPKRDDMLKIAPTDKGMSVSFAEVSFHYSAPKNTKDIREVYQSLQNGFQEESSVWLNASYLKAMANSIAAGDKTDKAGPVKVALQNPLKPVKLSCGDADGFLLPIRPPRQR